MAGALVRTLMSRDVGLRVTVGLGLAEDALGIALAAVAPFLLKDLIDQLSVGRFISAPLGGEVALFVMAWVSPNLLSALKVHHTTAIVERLFAAIVRGALQTQLGRGVDGFNGVVLNGLLERTPDALRLMFDGVVWRVAPLILQTLATLAAMAALLPPLMVITLAVTSLAYVAVTGLGAKRYQTALTAYHEAAQTVSEQLGDLIGHASRAIFNGAAHVEIDRLCEFVQVRGRASATSAAQMMGTIALQFGVLVLGVGLMLLQGAQGVLAHHLGVGTFVMAQAYAFRLVLPLGVLTVSLRQAGPAMQTLVSILALTGRLPARPAQPAAAPALHPGQDLMVNALSYRHSGSRAGVFDVSFSARAGSLTVIAGANGAGKSTLARLLSGQGQPDSGSISVGGLDLRSVDPAARVSVALYAPQQVQLFNRSLRETGLYPPTTQTEAVLKDRLEGLQFMAPGQIDLDAPIGADGGFLSGGQRQKLELARLMGTTPHVLVLDESTSALDGPSAWRAVAELRQSLPDTILFLVTHERRLAEAADQVVYLREGRVAGLGRHDALQKSDPTYRQLWKMSDGRL